MAEKLNITDFIGLTDEGKQILENQSSFVADAKRRVKYEDGKPTDDYDGAVLTIQVNRGERFANARYNLIVDDDVDVENVLDKDVIVHIENAKVYARTSKNSTYASVELSLHGSVDFVNDETNLEQELISMLYAYDSIAIADMTPSGLMLSTDKEDVYVSPENDETVMTGAVIYEGKDIKAYAKKQNFTYPQALQLFRPVFYGDNGKEYFIRKQAER